MTSMTAQVFSFLVTWLLVATAARSAMPTEYKCSGNEPFWGLAIDGERAGWATPEEPRGRSLQGTYQRLDYAALFAWRGRFGEADLVALVTEQQCSDTMADRDYPFSVTVSLPDGRVALGCCESSSRPSTEHRAEPRAEDREAPAPPQTLDETLDELPIAILDDKPPGDWSRSLLELLPALRACLDRTPGGSPRALNAWSMMNGRVGARTTSGGSESFECVANLQGTGVESFITLTSPAPPPSGGWSPIFTPPERRPPTGACYQHERVVAADGSLLGWLSYDTC
jgi:uncharacterized membrane protein